MFLNTILMSMGVSSYSAYKDAGGNEIPKMYLLIDNFNAFKELYLETYESEYFFCFQFRSSLI